MIAYNTKLFKALILAYSAFSGSLNSLNAFGTKLTLQSQSHTSMGTQAGLKSTIKAKAISIEDLINPSQSDRSSYPSDILDAEVGEDEAVLLSRPGPVQQNENKSPSISNTNVQSKSESPKSHTINESEFFPSTMTGITQHTVLTQKEQQNNLAGENRSTKKEGQSSNTKSSYYDSLDAVAHGKMSRKHQQHSQCLEYANLLKSNGVGGPALVSYWHATCVTAQSATANPAYKKACDGIAGALQPFAREVDWDGNKICNIVIDIMNSF